MVIHVFSQMLVLPLLHATSFTEDILTKKNVREKCTAFMHEVVEGSTRFFFCRFYNSRFDDIVSQNFDLQYLNSSVVQVSACPTADFI